MEIDIQPHGRLWLRLWLTFIASFFTDQLYIFSLATVAEQTYALAGLL